MLCGLKEELREIENRGFHESGIKYRAKESLNFSHNFFRSENPDNAELD